MKAPRSPAFQFYPAEFLADANVVMMSNRELGCYIKLMCFCWREGSIPSDVSKLAKLCGEDGSAMADLWIAIGSCFDSAINDPSKLVHHRLEKERQKQEEHRKERAESGLKGAKSRWNNHLKKDSSANGSAIEQPMANDGSSSSSSSSNIKPIVTKSRRVQKTSLPDEIIPTEKHRDFAGIHGLSLSAEMEKFRLHHEEKLTKSGNWNSSFSKWLNNAVEFRARNAPAKTFADKQQQAADLLTGRSKHDTRLLD